MNERDTGNDEARRLAAARVLVVGVGALGCPAARALAAAGIGTIVLIDPDRVELSNLHRQLLHGTDTIGRAKVESAAAALHREFPGARLETHAVRLDQHNLPELFAGADFVIDATDGAAAKLLINDGAVRCGIPFSHAGILGFLGQTLTVLPGRSTCYRCLFPEPPSEAEVVSCRDAGVIGPLAGVVGTIQAGEAIKHLTGQGEPLVDLLLTIDARSGRWRRVRLARNPRCPVCAAPTTGRRLDAAEAAR
ncbi:MAG TPA: HesA/MoeB/ThiF family protein [Candidatus Dormibacteraeota bacterium]|nr:HesA/MoeB/ThiF family protein [Candidatus Dormibacteraeota bacterium]